MKKMYEVLISETYTASVDVEADNEVDAKQLARELYDNDFEYHPDTTCYPDEVKITLCK
jgi:hypothetical protein